MGSIIPGIGTVAGAAIGALSGGVSGGTRIFEAKDDVFKNYVQEAAESAMEEQDTLISSGSAIAGSREQTRMSFARRLGGEAEADAFLAEVRAKAAATNYSYDEILGYSKALLNSYKPDEIFGVLQSLSDATAGLDLSSSDVSMMIAGLSRMRTTGKATQEYLNYFSERGVDVYAALADSTGADKSQIADMVTKGQIGGADAAESILAFIDKTFGGLSEDLMGTYDAMVDNLADAEANLQEYAGQGYNEERKRGIEAQQDWMTESEEALGEAYSAIGAWEASLENSKEQFIRDAMDAMMESDAYKTAEAEGDAVKMGELLMRAKVQGMNAYNASDGARLALESELSLASSIREDAASNQAYWDAGYRKSQEYSKGLAAGFSALHPTRELIGIANAAIVDDSEYPSAYGHRAIPYDNFPALLHQGERVLTASEARAMDAGTAGGGVQVSIGSVTIGGGLSTWDIAVQIAQELERAAVAAAPR